MKSGSIQRETVAVQNLVERRFPAGRVARLYRLPAAGLECLRESKSGPDEIAPALAVHWPENPDGGTPHDS